MRPSSLPIVRAALAALLIALPVLAQDAPDAGAADAEAPALEPERPYKLWVEWTPWFVQPIGLDLDLVTEIDPRTFDVYRGRTLPTPFGTDDATRWRFGVTLPKEFGEVVLSYWSTSNRYEDADARPGEFLYGTNLAYPAYAGIFDDSLADSYESHADVATRDLRIEFRRVIASGPKMTTTWSVGARWVDANLVTGATYGALGAPIPAFYDPPDTVEPEQVYPISDRASSSARFSGRGLSTGIEIRAPFGSRFQLECGFDASLLRGDKDADYSSLTSAYFLNDAGDLTYLGEEELLDPEITGDVVDLQNILQVEFPIYAQDPGSSGSASAFEAYVGFRARVWRTLEILGGYRAVRYEGILTELRPTALTSVGTVAVPSLERRERSLAYEGFYVGAAFTY